MYSFLFSIMIVTINGQGWFQHNLDSKQHIYQSALMAGSSYIRETNPRDRDIAYVALYSINESYNQRFRVVLSKRKENDKIELNEVLMYTGKSTSGRFVVTEWMIYDDLDKYIGVSNSLYLKIQKEIINHLRREENKTLKYIKSIKQIKEAFFIAEVVVMEDGVKRSYILNLDTSNLIRIPYVYVN